MEKWSGTISASMNNRIQEKEERLSSIEDTIEGKDSSIKENNKSNRNLTQNI